MNLIEALKVNGKARRKGCFWEIIKDNVGNYSASDSSSPDVSIEHAVADDWEPVREPKKWEGTFGQYQNDAVLRSALPLDAKVTIEWEE